MRKVLFILLFMAVFIANTIGQPYGHLSSRYPANWDADYPEYIAVFDGLDDYLNSDLLTSPDVVIEMEVYLQPGMENYQKFFGTVDNPYFSMGYRSGDIYVLANGDSQQFALAETGIWKRLRFDPKRGFAAFGDSVNIFTARNVEEGDSLIFGGQWDEPNQNFLNYEWRYIKIWDKGRLTHYLTPQPDGSIKNLKSDSIYYNKGRTTNTEPLALRYLGNIPNVAASVSTFDGIGDKVQYDSFDEFDWTSGGDSIINISFKFKPNTIDQNTTVATDRTVTYRNLYMYLSDNERFTVQTATASGTYWATSSSLEPYYADSVHTVNIEIDDHVGVKTVTVSGSFNMSYTYSGDLETATNSTFHMGQKNTSYFNGYIWDVNLDDQFYFPLPDMGYGFKNNGGSYTTVALNVTGSPGNLEATYGTQWGNQYGYVYRGSTDEILLNNPSRDEAYALINGDIHYHLLGASTTNYYINPIAGNDNNTGTSPSDAWKTVDKVNAMQPEFYGGDSVLFIANSVFTQQLIPTKSGSPATKINYGRYGSGANPVFSGFTTLTQEDFTNVSGDIWESKAPVTTADDVHVLYTDGKVWSKARMPNVDGGSRLGYHMMTASSGGSSGGWLASDELNPAYNYDSLLIVSRKRHWIMDTLRVTNQSGTTLYFTGGHPSYGLTTGGFFFFNDQRCVDLDNEWYFRYSNKHLGIKKSGAFTPVKISTKEYLIDLNGVNHLSFTGLDFEGANIAAFYMRNVNGIKVEHCNIQYSYDGILGINLSASRNFLISNNNIKHLMNNAVWLDTDFKNGAITYNQIDTIAPFAGMGGRLDGTYNGLRIQGDSVDMSYNTLIYIGYNPISFDGVGSTVTHNFIYWFNHVKDDGSAIYCARQNSGRIIADNLIMHGIGAPAGYVEKVNPWDAIWETNGIYLDDNARYVTVLRNVIYDVPNIGIFLHRNPGDHYIAHNQVFDARGYNGGVNIQSEPRNGDTVAMRNIYFKHNIIVSMIKNHLPFRVETWFDDLDQIGDIDSNLYANPVDSDYVAGYRDPSVTGTQRLKLIDYQAALPFMDQNTVDPKKTVYLRETFEFKFNPSRTDSLILTFPDTMMNFWKDTIYPGEELVLQPLKGELLINAGNILPYRKYYFANDGDDANSGLDSLNPKKSMKELVALMPELIAGDKVLLNRGDTWYVPDDTLLRIKKSGELADPIYFGAYGSGANPVISGYKTVESWTALGGNLYESNQTIPAITPPLITSIDDTIRQKGRFPNTGWLNIDAAYADEQITVNALDGYDFTGADLVGKKTREVIDVASIEIHSGSGLATTATGREYEAGFGVFVTNSPAVLDVPFEWYFNPSTQKITVYANGTPATTKVSAADYLVDIQQQRNIVIENIDFEGANISAIWLKSGKAVTVRNCNIRDSFNGLHANRYTSAGLPTTAYGLKVLNNTFTNITNNPLNIESEYGNALVEENTFDSNGLIAGLGGSGFNQYGIIKTDVIGATIRNNVITNSGYMPINVNRSGVTIENNFIDTYCLVKDNNAGISVSDSGNVVQANIVVNGIGNNAGTPYATPSAYGIWAKHGHKYITINSNSIYNMANSGLLAYNGQGYTAITNNVAVKSGNSTFGVLNIQTDDGSNAFRNNTITGNVLGALLPGQPVARLYTTTNDIANWGTFNNNIYTNAIDTTATIRYQVTTGVYDVDLATWKGVYALDAASSDPQKHILTLSDYIFSFNQEPDDKVVVLPWQMYDVMNESTLPAGTIALPQWSCIYLIKDE